MNKIFVSLFLFITFLLAAGCGEEKIEGYKLYENDEHSFTLQYPEDWTFREGFAKESGLDLGSIVVFQSPSEGKFDLFRENIHVFTEALPDSVNDIDSYLQYSKIYLPTQLQQIEFKEEGRIMINGKPSRWILFDYVNQLQLVSCIGYIFYMDGYGMVITGTTRPEEFMSYRRTFETISTSIKFK